LEESDHVSLEGIIPEKLRKTTKNLVCPSFEPGIPNESQECYHLNELKQVLNGRRIIFKVIAVVAALMNHRGL
jgi:hypothetical protein